MILTAERRRSRRYDLHLPVHYRVSERGSAARSGTGTTCEVSTNGLSFRTRKPLRVGSHVEMVIDWPAKFADEFPVDLRMTGFIVRSRNGRVGVRITSHKFRVETAVVQPYKATA